LAGAVLNPHIGAEFVALPARSSRAVGTFLQPVFDPHTLRQLATTAIEAAIHAGADWADVRLGDHRAYDSAGATLLCGYSLRVRIRGVDAFTGGTELTPETLVAAARSAVTIARGLASLASTAESLSLAPTPVVTGEWRTPVEIDPFAVSIDDHAFVSESVGGMYDGPLLRMGCRVNAWYRWSSETRVFASSEGSLLTQFLTNVDAGKVVSKDHWRHQWANGERVELPVPSVQPCSGGFEVAVRPDRYASVQATAEDVLRYAALPSQLLDVGRQHIILDGALHAQLLGSLLPALSLHRALGNDMDVTGASLFAPPEAVLGQQRFSPLLHCMVDTGVPHFGAAAWDDEGVATTGLPLIVRGIVVNYLSTRATFPALAALLPSGRMSNTIPGAIPGTIPGVAYGDLSAPPAEVARSVSVRPSSNACPLPELAKVLGNGLLAHGGWTWMDPAGNGGYIYPTMMGEVRNGNIVRRVFGPRLMFSTKRFLPTLSTVGDASTIGATMMERSLSGFPWVVTRQAVTAPAGHYRDIDIVPRAFASS